MTRKQKIQKIETLLNENKKFIKELSARDMPTITDLKKDFYDMSDGAIGLLKSQTFKSKKDPKLVKLINNCNEAIDILQDYLDNTYNWD